MGMHHLLFISVQVKVKKVGNDGTGRLGGDNGVEKWW